MLKRILDKSLKSKIKTSAIVDSQTIEIVPTTKTNLMF